MACVLRETNRNELPTRRLKVDNLPVYIKLTDLLSAS